MRVLKSLKRSFNDLVNLENMNPEDKKSFMENMDDEMDARTINIPDIDNPHDKNAGSLSDDIADEYKTIDALNDMVEDGIESGSGRSAAVYSSSDEDSKSSKPTWEEMNEQEGTTNSFWTSFNLMNDILSSAVVAVPSYVASTGIYLFIPTLLFFGGITHTLYHLARKNNITTYPELCQHGLGTPGYITLCIWMFIYNVGNFLGGLMIVGSNGPRLLQWIIGFDSYWISRTWVLVYTAVIFLPLSFFKKISDYKFNSFLSCAGLMALALLLVSRAIYGREPAPEGSFDFKVSESTFASFGGLSFLFICHDLSFGIFTSHKKSTRKRWSRVVIATLTQTISFFILTGLGGWFIFYDDCMDNILDNFAVNDTLANVGRLLLTLNILISVPYNMFMPRFSIYALVSRFIPIENKNLFHILTTVFFMAAMLTIAEFVTDLGAMFEVVGGISAVGLAYIMPPLLYLKLEDGVWYKGTKLKHTIIAVLGIIMMFGSTTSSLYDNTS